MLVRAPRGRQAFRLCRRRQAAPLERGRQGFVHAFRQSSVLLYSDCQNVREKAHHTPAGVSRSDGRKCNRAGDMAYLGPAGSSGLVWHVCGGRGRVSSVRVSQSVLGISRDFRRVGDQCDRLLSAAESRGMRARLGSVTPFWTWQGVLPDKQLKRTRCCRVPASTVRSALTYGSG